MVSTGMHAASVYRGNRVAARYVKLLSSPLFLTASDASIYILLPLVSHIRTEQL